MATLRRAGAARPVPRLSIGAHRVRPTAHAWAQPPAGVFMSNRISNPRAVSYAMLALRSEEHTSELQSLMRISYAVFCLKKKNIKYNYNKYIISTQAQA